MIKLIMFDLDNTLYKEREYVLSGFREVAKYLENKHEINFFETYSILTESLIANGRGNNFDAIIKKKDLSLSLIPILVKVYREHIPNISLRDDTDYFLKELSKKYKLCLITDGWEEVQKKKVEALGIKDYFDLILYSQSDGIEHAKPHKKFFLKALKSFDVFEKEVLMIGDDNEKDFVGAQNLGIKAFLINDLLNKKEQLKIKKIIKEND